MMPIRPSLLLPALLSLLALPLTAQEPALPISIEADRLEMTQLDGRSHYQGNVELQQGEMHLRSDTLEIRQEQGQLQRAIAKGSPVRLEMPDEQTGQLIRAEAGHMDYQLTRDRIELRGAAVLWRGKDEFRGEHLIYHIQQRSVQAFGTPGTDSTDGRVRIILQQEPAP